MNTPLDEIEGPFPSANKCRHFVGLSRMCGAGVNWREIARVEEEGTFGCALRVPCRHDTNGTPYICPKLDRMSDEEIAVEEAESDRRITWLLEKMPIARDAIIGDVKARGALLERGRRRVRIGRYVSAAIHCPVCDAEGETLAYTYAGNYNGHVHAECSTPGCVKWGE